MVQEPPRWIKPDQWIGVKSPIYISNRRVDFQSCILNISSDLPYTQNLSEIGSSPQQVKRLDLKYVLHLATVDLFFKIRYIFFENSRAISISGFLSIYVLTLTSM